MDCSCIASMNGDDIITTQIIHRLQQQSPKPKKLSLKKKVLIESLVEEGNIKTEKDKLSQNKSIMRILSDQDKYFDASCITVNAITEKLQPSYSSLSVHTQIKWNESLINYIIRYMKLHKNYEDELQRTIEYLKSEKKRLKNIASEPASANGTAKQTKDYLSMYSSRNVSYRNKIYAKIKIDGYPVSDVIISNTRIADYILTDTFIDIKNKKWIINEKKHIEFSITDEFIKDISVNKFSWLANDINNNKISSTVINNGIHRWFAL